MLDSTLSFPVQVTRCVTELHANLRLTLVQGLTRLEQKRYAVPTRVIDEQSHRGERRAKRSLRHRLVVQIRRILLPIGFSSLVLTQRDIIHLNRTHAANHLDLFVANVLRVQARRFLHREERQDLQQVVLHNVANDAVVIEITTATFGAKVFTKVDLHVADVVSVPKRLEHDVRKAHDGEVLDQLLPEVVIDAIRLLLAQVLRERRGQLARARQVSPERFLYDDSRDSSLALTLARRVLRHRYKDARRNAQVKHALYAAHRAFIFAHQRVQRLEVLRLIVLTRHVHAPREEFFRLCRAVLLPRPTPVDETRQRLRDFIPKLLRRHARSRVAVNHEILRQPSLVIQREQRRVDFLLRQVPARAEDHERQHLPFVVPSLPRRPHLLLLDPSRGRSEIHERFVHPPAHRDVAIASHHDAQPSMPLDISRIALMIAAPRRAFRRLRARSRRSRRARRARVRERHGAHARGRRARGARPARRCAASIVARDKKRTRWRRRPASLFA